MEKSFATDPPGVRRVIEAGEAAERKNVKIAAGLMCRHSREPPGADPAHPRRRNWARSNSSAPIACKTARPMGPKPAARKGAVLADPQFHQLLLGFRRAVGRNGHPPDRRALLAQGRLAGRRARRRRTGGASTDYTQNLDSFSAEWTFADGTKALRRGPLHSQLLHRVCHLRARHQVRRAVLRRHPRATVQIYKDQRMRPRQRRLGAPQGALQPLAGRMERSDGRHPQRPALQRGQAGGHGEPGRHHGPGGRPCGQVVTWDEALASKFQWCPNIDNMAENPPPPVRRRRGPLPRARPRGVDGVVEGSGFRL